MSKFVICAHIRYDFTDDHYKMNVVVGTAVG